MTSTQRVLPSPPRQQVCWQQLNESEVEAAIFEQRYLDSEFNIISEIHIVTFANFGEVEEDLTNNIRSKVELKHFI